MTSGQGSEIRRSPTGYAEGSSIVLADFFFGVDFFAADFFAAVFFAGTAGVPARKVDHRSWAGGAGAWAALAMARSATSRMIHSKLA